MNKASAVRSIFALAFASVAVSACKGDPGNPGPAGERGPSGGQGTQGNTGQPGAGGMNGSNGLTSLIAIIAEPPGSNCTFGGDAVQAGVDDNLDNVLDAAEIDSTAYVCDAAPAASVGDVIVDQLADIEALAGLTIVRGNLIVVPFTDAAPPALGALDLSSIAEVTGNVNVEGNAGLTALNLRNLHAVGGTISIDDNQDLTTIDLSGLATVSGSILIGEAPVLTSLHLDSLVSVAGELIISTESNARMGVKSPNQVGGDLYFGDNAGPSSFEVDGVLLVGDDVTIHQNERLSNLSGPSLSSVGHDVYVTNNPALSTANAQNFANSINHGGNTIVGANGP